MPIPAGSTGSVSPVVGGVSTVRLVDGSTTIWLRPATPTASDPIACGSHEITPPSPRVVSQPRTGRSGVDDLTAFHDGAQFKASLVVRDGDGLTRHEHLDQIRALTHPARRPWLYIQRAGWPSERRALLRGDPLTSVITRESGIRVLASLQFAIPGGVLEDTVVPDPVVLRPSGTSVGMSFPMSFPMSFAAMTAGSATTITLTCSSPVYPLLRLYGMAGDPVIRLIETGQQVELDNVTIPAGQYMDIDMAARTVLLNGDPALNYYNKVNFATTDWWALQPGAINTITVSTSTSDASAELDVYYTPLWIAG